LYCKSPNLGQTEYKANIFSCWGVRGNKIGKFGKYVTLIKFQSGRYTINNELTPDQDGEVKGTAL
jgi:hypothetical protein